jgi:hypothetical protein
MLDYHFDHILFEATQVFRGCHLNNRVLIEVHSLLFTCQLVIFDVDAQVSQFAIIQQAYDQRDPRGLTVMFNVFEDVSIIGFAIATPLYPFARALRHPKLRPSG